MNYFTDIDKIISLTAYLAVTGAGIAYVIATWKNNKGKADSDTIETYRGELSVLQIKVNRLEDDNKELIRQQGILTGENKTLKDALALRNPGFEKAFLELTKSIVDMRDDLRGHYEDDKKNFNAIKDVDDRKMKILEGILSNQVKKIIPELDKHNGTTNIVNK